MALKVVTTCCDGMGTAFTNEARSIASARGAASRIRDSLLASYMGWSIDKVVEVFSGQDERLITVGGKGWGNSFQQTSSLFRAGRPRRPLLDVSLGALSPKW